MLAETQRTDTDTSRREVIRGGQGRGVRQERKRRTERPEGCSEDGLAVFVTLIPTPIRPDQTIHQREREGEHLGDYLLSD
jgi:hypothetical protein